jgi:hypothetical protein
MNGIRKFIMSVTVVAVVGFGAGAGLAACSSGGGGLPNATSVLQANGYTPSASYTSALQSGLSGTTGVTSSEAGTNGDNIQLVIVFDNSADASAGASGVQSQYGSDGITTTSNGDVLTATGTVSDFVQAGG